MTWPIPTLPTNWTNAVSQYDNHPAAHNALADAVNEMYARLPRGYIGLGVQSLNQTGIGAGETDITGMSVTWTAEPTRRYKTTACVILRQSATAGEQFLHIVNAANAHLKSSAFGAVGALGVATHTVVVSEVGLSGAQTRKGRCSVSPGTAATNANEYVGFVLVEDIGGV